MTPKLVKLVLLLVLALVAHMKVSFAQSRYTSASAPLVTGTVFPVTDQGGQVYNVKAYGAVCDGATDDSSAIQSAVTAMPSEGGTLFFPSGSCVIGTPISLDKPVKVELGAGTYTATTTAFTVSSNGVSIVGKGPFATAIQTTSMSPLITNSSAIQGLVIKGISLTGPTSGSSGSGLIDLDNFNTSQISDIYMTGGYYGLHVQETWNDWFSGFVILDAIQAGLFLDGSTTNVIQSHFYNFAIGNGLHDGLLMTASSGEVDALTFTNLTTYNNQNIGINLQSANGSNSFFHCETTDERGPEQWYIGTSSNSFYYVHAERTTATNSYDYVVAGNNNVFFYPRAFRGTPSGIYVTGNSNTFYYPFTSNTGTNAIEVSGQYNHFYSGYLATSPTGILEDTGANFNVYSDIQMGSVATPNTLVGNYDQLKLVGSLTFTLPYGSLQLGSTSGPKILISSGAPTGSCTTGSLDLNTSGGTSTTLYVCESSEWVPK